MHGVRSCALIYHQSVKKSETLCRSTSHFSIVAIAVLAPFIIIFGVVSLQHSYREGFLPAGHSPQATVTTVWKTPVCKRGILKCPVSYVLNFRGLIKLIFDTNLVIKEFN